ncbi:MAG: ATP-binding protein [Coleofasciculus sp. A1-SPW-01]|uniref:ATP-binding protein n=1 Tax=Coleofasciculus sp. A1-SPW-01 TaxID=3070819 RepID=UPI0032F0C599
MEPITWGWILAAALSGIVGNKADVGLDTLGKGLKGMINRLKSGDAPMHQEIQMAVGRAFLLAQQSLVEDCLSELMGGKEYKNSWDCPPQYKNEITWLNQKLKRLKADLQKLEKGQFGELAVTPVADIDSLLTPDGALVGDTLGVVRQQLMVVLQQENAIALYQTKAVTPQVGLFERMCAYFAVEMQHNPVLREMIQGQLLTQINANLKTQQVTVKDLTHSLQNLARDVVRDMGDIKELLERLNNQMAALSVRQLPVPDDFRWIVEDKTKGFVGREFVFDAIEEFFQQQRKGYFIIGAEPGMGKSSILAEFVRRNDCIVYFNQRNEGITSAEQFLRSVCIQLIQDYGLSHSQDIQPENTCNSNFFKNLLNEVRGKLKLNERLVIAVDALDEVDLSSQSRGANVLYLPEDLPDDVYLIVTKRLLPPDQLPLRVNNKRLFDVMQHPARNQEDVEAYIRQRINGVGASVSVSIRQWIQNRGANEEEFVSTLVEKSEGNFMYLRYVLDDIEKGAYPKLEIRGLPSGLQDYYYKHWERMGMNDKPLFKIKIVYILSESPIPIPFEEIVAILDADGEEEIGLAVRVQAILDEWMQFLREEEKYGQIFYSLYHSSFRDFLRNEKTVKRAGITLQGIIEMMANSR